MIIKTRGTLRSNHKITHQEFEITITFLISNDKHEAQDDKK